MNKTRFQSKCLLSLAFLIGGILLSIDTVAWQQDPWSTGAFAGYVVWALFWGFPAVWRWGRWIRTRGWRPEDSFPVAMMKKVAAWALLIFGGYWFSVLGGGVIVFLNEAFRASRRL